MTSPPDDAPGAAPAPGRVVEPDRIGDGLRPRTSEVERSVRQPWWIPPFLGRVPPEIEERHLTLLGVVALAYLFENYDISMLGAALKHIRESFGLSSAETGTLTALVRLGAVPAILLVPFADRIGRRRLFLTCVAGCAVTTVLTAFTANVDQFIACQLATRTFLLAGSATAVVIITEEFPAQHRGWGVGLLATLGSVGYGFGALLFAFVDVLPFGWRFMYGVGILPLFFLGRFRRAVAETDRFERHVRRSTGPGASGASGAWWTPLYGLLRAHPRRAAAIGLVGLLSAAGHGPALQLLSDFVQSEHGWAPWAYSTMVILGGLLGIVGNTIAGRMSDRMGRRQLGFWLLAAFPIFASTLYNGPGWAIAISWVPLVFFTTGANTILRALSTELFATASRSTAAGWVMLCETIGAAVALHLVTVVTISGESVAPAISVLVFACLLGGLTLYLLPETARIELETLSGEAPHSSPEEAGDPSIDDPASGKSTLSDARSPR